jgi:hypothetical protein
MTQAMASQERTALAELAFSLGATYANGPGPHVESRT